MPALSLPANGMQRPRIVRGLCALFLGLLAFCCAPDALGQAPLNPWGAHAVVSQTGTAAWQYFSLQLPAGPQGFQLVAESVSGTGGLEIFLQSGTTNPTESQFLRQSAPGTRILDVAPGELAPGEYRIGLRYSGATSSTTAQNRLRLIPRLDPAGGILTNRVENGRDLFFRIEVPQGHPGLRALLSRTNGTSVELSLQQGVFPQQGLFRTALDPSPANAPRSRPETVWLTDAESTPGTWLFRIAGLAPGANTVVFRWERGFATTLAWDPGTLDGGTQVHSNPADDPGGLRFLRINAEGTDIGAWRTILKVESGNASFRMQNAAVPAQPGSGLDGIFQPGSQNSARLLYDGQYAPSQEWFIAVNAAPGSRWSLFSGRAYVQSLGNPLPPDTSTANNAILDTATAEVGPEGLRFYRATIPAGTPAWRLWANNGASSPASYTLPLDIREARIAAPGGGTLRGQGQMLVVPPNLNPNNAFFITVTASERTRINLDSRIQRVEALAFGTPVPTATLGAFRFRTYRVDVPDNSLGWQVNARTISGDVDLYLRRGEVPNADNNLTFSDAEGAVGDSVTLVPPTLSNGTYYLTVYGKEASNFTIDQGQPTVTDIPFVNSREPIPGYPFTRGFEPITNDDINRNGWRYYRVADRDSQGVTLGWFLRLAGEAPPGIESAIRAGSLPGRWKTGQHLDLISTSGFMELQGHRADTWYVGIHSPARPLGRFELETRPFLPRPVDIAAGPVSVTNQAGGSWEYLSFDIPADAATNGLLALEIQLEGANLSGLRTQIRANRLPFDSGIPLANATALADWPEGGYVNGGGDWTSRRRPNDASDYCLLPFGWPLREGRYFLGIRNDSASSRSYAVRFRTVGPGRDHVIHPFAFNPSGSSTNVTLPNPRDFRIHRVEVPAGQSMVRFSLGLTSGEARLYIRQSHLPGLPGLIGNLAVPYDGRVTTLVARRGPEEVTLLPPPGQTNVPAGIYHVLVAAEGTPPQPDNGAIGTGPTQYTLSILPALSPDHLGTVAAGDSRSVEQAFTPPVRPFHTIDVDPSVQALEVRLENLGTPAVRIQWLDQDLFPEQGSSSANYGWVSGHNRYERVSDVLHLIPPRPGRYAFTLESADGSSTTHRARVTIRALPAVPLDAGDGTAVVEAQGPLSWRFFEVRIPASFQGATPAAWDLRINDATHNGPHIVVARDTFPSALAHDLGEASGITRWPSGARMIGDYYTHLRAQGTARDAKALALAWGWPITNGTYVVGVFNNQPIPVSYSLRSRLIGRHDSTAPLRVESIPFTGSGTLATINDLPAGEARHFRFEIPPGTPHLRLRLAQLRGEARLLLRRGSLPGSHLIRGFPSQQEDRMTTVLARVGDEVLSLLPEEGQTEVPPGAYFLSVISEGDNAPNVNVLGSGSISARVDMLAPVQPVDLGTLVLNQPLEFTNTVSWPDRAYYRITVPPGGRTLHIRVQNLADRTTLNLRPGLLLPSGSGPGTPDILGLGMFSWSGGASAPLSINGVREIPNPTPGTYSFLLDHSLPSATCIVTFNLSGETPLDFVNGDTTYTHPALAWRYFRVEVPTNAPSELGVEGWEVRISNSPTDEGWSLQIRRDPPGDQGFNIGDHSTSWPSGGIYGATPVDWSGRVVPGLGNAAHLASMAWGRPLGGGTYFIGVYNGSDQPRPIRLRSRAIGNPGHGLPIEIQPLTWGQPMDVTIPTPGDIRYYRFHLPQGLSRARLSLQAIEGDSRMVLRQGWIPGGNADSGSVLSTGGQVRSGNAGTDHIQWGARQAEQTLPANVPHYLLVVGEGNPTNPDNGRLGSGSSTARILSSAFDPQPLGTVFPGTDLVANATFSPSEVLGYDFTVPDGSQAIELRLEDRVGNPLLEAGRGPGFLSGTPGWFDGFASVLLANRVRSITLPNPTPGRHWVAVGRDGSQATAGSFRLRVRNLAATGLAFSQLDSDATRTNRFRGILADGQRTYFSVDVPTHLAGEPVLGWNLRITPVFGSPRVRVIPGDAFPLDGSTAPSQYATRSLIVAPPFFRPGRWTVEVRGNGDSEFVLESERIELQRPAWRFPDALEPLNASNLIDTRVLPDGSALPEDVNLAQDQYHFYAIDVPQDNGGLMRVELSNLSGNPDLYVRTGAIPSREAAQLPGDFGPSAAFDYSLVSGSSESANWVPKDTRRELRLTPGRWYFMVHANGSNARYRFEVTRGRVTRLDSLTTTLQNQAVLGGDWGYYRFFYPTNAPLFWDLNIRDLSNEIDVFIRDSAPPGVPGNGGTVAWEDENKNSGIAYRSFSGAGTWRLSVPQLRPGHPYYIGVRARREATFTLATSTSGSTLPEAFPPHTSIDPAGGSVTGTLAPSERRTYRIQIPPDALRLKITGTNPPSVGFYLQNGSIPWASRHSPADHWASFDTANASFDVPLQNRLNGGWPWVADETFYVAVTNQATSPQPFTLKVDTRAWRLELAATNGSISANPNRPFHDDGTTVSLQPQPATGHRFVGWSGDLSGTNQPGSILMSAHRRVVALFEPIPYTLAVTATGGSVQVNPPTPTHPFGSTIRLTAVPNPGHEFVRWSGSVVSDLNPISIVVSGNLAVTAHFNKFADPPGITTQPQGATVAAGGPLELSIQPSGTPPFSYEWLRNGARVALTSEPRFHLAATRTNDAGFYSVRVTNIAGGILSDPAPVHVRFSQTIAFTNPAPIVLPDAAPAATYPSTLSIPPGTGRIGGVSVSLHGISHPWLEDIDLLLVAPSGAATLLLSDALRGPVNNFSPTFDDLAPGPLPESGPPGTSPFQPSNYEGLPPVTDAFPTPAPSSRIGSRLSGLIGSEVAGDWRLFALDDSPKADGTIGRGWSLQFQVFGLQPAANDAAVLPLFVTLPADAAIRSGEVARFTADALGNPAPALRWQTSSDGVTWQNLFNSGNTSGANERTLTLANVPADWNNRRFRLLASNTAGSVPSPEARLTVSETAATWATRQLPGSFIPGRSFPVILAVVPPSSTAFHAVSDRPPTNWTVSAISEGGIFDPATGQVKFGPFPDNAARTLRYSVTPPASANGRFEFSGSASADGVPHPIGGATVIENSVVHPADLNADNRLADDEVTAYGAAWRRDDTWSVAPNPIPANHVTRAGFLWRSGELYRFDSTIGSAPLWWIPAPGSGGSRSATPALDPAAAAVRSTNGASLVLTITPGPTATAYALEEQLFAGFIPSEISHGGTYLPTQNRIRWGPFFDNAERSLSYRLAPPSGFNGEIALLGKASIDGEDILVTGRSILRFGTLPLPPPVQPELEGDRLAVGIRGPLNARVLIETTHDLAAPWDLATEFLLQRQDQDWSVPVEIQQSGRFFRVRIESPR